MGDLGRGGVLRFPGGDGPGQLEWDYHLGVGLDGYGAMDVDARGYVYYGRLDYTTLYILFAPGKAALLDTLPNPIASLTLDDAGNLFVLTTRALYRYDYGAPATRHIIVAFDGTEIRPGWSTIVPSLDEDSIWLTRFANRLERVNAITGELEESVNINPDAVFESAGGGMAIYVPEPSSFLLVLVLASFAGLRARAR